MGQQKVKIAYLINGLGRGGAEMMLLRLLERLDRDLYFPVVISLLDLGGPIKMKIEALRIPVHVVDIKAKYDFIGIIRLGKLLRNEAPSILHTQLFAADIMGRVFGKLLRIPIIITSIRNCYYGGFLRELMIKLTEKYADKTTIVSKGAARQFVERGVVPEDKLKVIYNGLDSALFQDSVTWENKKIIRARFRLPEECFLWICVGSLTRQKGHLDLFEALKMIPEANYCLAVAGSGPLNEFLKAKAKEHIRRDKIIFMGNIDNVPELMSSADALVLSSHWEGLPGVVLEAMASELPVVVTSVGGTPEIVKDGVTGFLVPPNSPGELAKALTAVMMLSVEKRYVMGKAARNLVIDNFHVDKMVKAYEDLYFECLQEKNLL